MYAASMAQQRMTLSDLKWPFHASRAISAVAELLLVIVIIIIARSFCATVCLLCICASQTN